MNACIHKSEKGPTDATDPVPVPILVQFAHQLNNLLNPVLCYSALLEREKEQFSESNKKRINKILTFSTRSAEHIAFLQVLFRPIGDPSIFNIVEIIQDEITQLNLDHEVGCSAPESPVFVKGVELDVRNLVRMFARYRKSAKISKTQVRMERRGNRSVVVQFHPGLPKSETFINAVWDAVLARHSGEWEQSDERCASIVFPIHSFNKSQDQY